MKGRMTTFLFALLVLLYILSVHTNSWSAKRGLGDNEIRYHILSSFPKKCISEIQNFQIDVKDGVVTVVGTTDIKHHKTMIDRVASYTDGVISVRNQIEYVGVADKDLTDRMIEDDLRHRLNEEKLDKKIDVSVRDGVAILEGRPYEMEGKQKVLEIAERTPGVQSVADNLRYDFSLRGPNY